MDKRIRQPIDNAPVCSGADTEFGDLERLASRVTLSDGAQKIAANNDESKTLDVIDRYKKNNDTIDLLLDEIVKWLGEHSVRDMNVDALKHALGEVKSLARSNFENDFSEISHRLALSPGAMELIEHGTASAQEIGDRQYFLLRFIACSFSDKIGQNGITRHVLLGFQKYLENLLGPELYEVLNDDCRMLLSDLDSLPDAEIWDEAFSDGWRRILALQILFRMVSQFHNFDRAVQTFLAVLENASPKNSQPPNKLTFIAIFDRLIRPLEFCLGDDADKVLFDFLFGDDGQQVVEDIKSQYTKWKSELQPLAK